MDRSAQQQSALLSALQLANLFMLLKTNLWLNIDTQQLDFLGTCQCRLNFLDMQIEARAQVPIIIDDTTQMDTLTLLPFPGSLLSITGYFYRIALSDFHNDYLLGNIHRYSVAAYVNMRTWRHVLLYLSNTEISLTENTVSFNATCISHARRGSHRRMWLDENMRSQAWHR